MRCEHANTLGPRFVHVRGILDSCLALAKQVFCLEAEVALHNDADLTRAVFRVFVSNLTDVVLQQRERLVRVLCLQNVGANDL